MSSKKSLLSNFGSDLPSGLVVFLVALPLCLGIALASGAPFFSGIISGIIGGIVIGSFSNSPLSVSGPAAGLAALVLGAITTIGDFSLFLSAVLLAGILQILLGVAKMGGIANYIPGSVIKGMLTSIGILIIAKQIPHAFGYDKDTKGNITELMPFGQEDLHELLQPLQHIDVGVFLLCLLSIIIMVLWDKPFIKKRVKFVPGALVAVIVAVIVNEIWIKAGSRLAVQNEHLVQIKVAGSASEFLSFFTLPDFNGFLNSTVIVYGVVIAIIASLETLLSIEAVDNLDPQRRVTSTNRELIAQGIGNSVAGLIGGLPVTSVIVRSSANVNSGAKSKLSAIIHGIMLLISIVLIPTLLNKIPLSALAAILLLTGYKLAKPAIFKNFWDAGKYQFIPFIVTVVVIIGVDLFAVIPSLSGKGLLVGVMSGIVAATASILYGNLRNSYFFHSENHHEGDIINVRLSEEVSFLNKAAIRKTLDRMPENSSVVIDASSTIYIDYDVLELIKEFRDIKAPLKNIKLQLKGFKESYQMENYSHVQSVH
ncbi:MAG TPA: SulP family inorganic anion transporter [Chitinophagaceae bacterium]|jgi:MFS superfamily sulfate permease-like transporter|nr:SulP family inorganic anion transporter [Chitinophagaceae bacterium]HMU56979.1 SulP family inorganic anion transporter [Chitinophagaceae bacterium]